MHKNCFDWWNHHKNLQSVLDDRQLKVPGLTNITNISIDYAHYILHDVLGIKKLSTQWVLYLLTADKNALDWTDLNVVSQSFFNILYQ